MLCAHLRNCPGIIISGICKDSNQLKKILELLKLDIIIIISTNLKFVDGCIGKIINKPLLLISSDILYQKFLIKTGNPVIGSDFQFISSMNGLSYLTEKLAILSNSKLKQTSLKDYSFISKREKEIINHICKGKKNKEIADELFLSVKTVENHRNNILRKTQHNSMMTLVNELYKIGFIS